MCPGSSDEFLLPLKGQYKRKQRPSAVSTAVRLYRGDAVWRGAVDLVILGLLVMGFARGLPDVIGATKRLIFSSMHQSADQQTAADTGLQPSATPTQSAVSPQASARVPFNLPGASSGIIAMPQASSVSSPAQTLPSSTGATISPAPTQSSSTVPVIPSLPNGNKFDRPDDTMIGAVAPADAALFEKAVNLVGLDDHQAVTLVLSKAAQGDANAQNIVGMADMDSGLRLKNAADGEGALDWLRRAAEQGHPVSQFLLGTCYLRGSFGLTKDLSQAVQWYRRSASNPDNRRGDAEVVLSELMRTKLVVPQDSLERERLLKQAAEKDNRAAENSLGVLYLEGKDAPQDLQQGRYWLQKSADNNDGLGQYDLALFYLKSDPANPDYGQFLKWATLAADQGVPGALLALGDFYREGAVGFPPNLSAAAKYYRLGAIKKDPKAQFYLAEMYERGAGIPKDTVQAYVYYSLSYENGTFGPAFSALQALKATMTQAEISNAEAMAQALRETSIAQ